ncbi:MAG: DUF6067 family protein [Armatimonadetes bacterium]|nr:DUF6067 family protein [Armatimonadota bacterium]
MGVAVILVFTGPRERPIRRVDAPPSTPNPTFTGAARPGEFFVFQVALVASMGGGEVGFVPGALGAIPASAMRCLSLGGVDAQGRAFTKRLSLEPGKTQVLWVGVEVPKSAQGQCAGTLTVTVGAERVPVEVVLTVTGKPLDDHGDSVAANLSRLRWLDSTAGSEPTVTKPFLPVQVSGTKVKVLGRQLTLGSDGLPAQIESAFNGSNTKLGKPTPLLAAPMRFVVETASRQAVWTSKRGKLTRTETQATWSATNRASGLTLEITGRLDYTGSGTLTMRLTADKTTDVREIALVVPLLPERAKLMMGLGKQGGAAPKTWDWKWDTKKHQDALWLGEVNAGLMLRLKGANFRRPLVNIYYGFQPLNLPESWGTGGVQVENGTIRAFSGPRTLAAGETLDFTVDFYLTPFKLLNTEAQWHDRYIHLGGSKSPEPHEKAVAEMDDKRGPNVLNVHQATFFSPYINYPYADASFSALQKLTQAAHTKNTRVKVYYTTREITQNMPELIPLHSLNGEVIVAGPGKNAKTLLHPNGPHPWLTENLGEDFIPAWQDKVGGPYAELDLSVITTPDSRWNNFYLEGLKWLCEKADIDGVYIDDAALDSHSLARARRILDRRPNRLIDFHTWNHFNDWAGYGTNLVIYQEFLPYLDRLWIGEGFPAKDAAPDYWLTEMSGIPFGMLSEMLDGAHPWRGLLFGETARLPWSGDPRPLWKAFDDYGIKNTEMIGFWDDTCPVKTNHPDVRATVYKAKDRLLIALASWAKTDVSVTLTLPKNIQTLHAAAIANFQPEANFAAGTPLPIPAGKGLFLLAAP